MMSISFGVPFAESLDQLKLVTYKYHSGSDIKYREIAIDTPRCYVFRLVPFRPHIPNLVSRGFLRESDEAPYCYVRKDWDFGLWRLLILNSFSIIHDGDVLPWNFILTRDQFFKVFGVEVDPEFTDVRCYGMKDKQLRFADHSDDHYAEELARALNIHLKP